MGKTRRSAYTLSVMGLLTALLLLQTFVPMFGYIRILPGVAITTMHLTVITAGVVLGPRFGATMGLIWGLISLTVAFVSPTDPLSLLLFRNPIIAIGPRVLCGLVAGSIAGRRTSGPQPGWRLMLSGVLGAMTNTAGVILGAWLFYGSAAAQIVGHGANQRNLGMVMISLLAVNAVVEALTAGIITPILGRILTRARRK